MTFSDHYSQQDHRMLHSERVEDAIVTMLNDHAHLISDLQKEVEELKGEIDKMHNHEIDRLEAEIKPLG